MARKPPEAKRAFVRFMARTLTGAHAAPFPAFIPPCNPSLRAKVPTGPGWQFEIKLDGYRAQLHLRGGKVTAYSRNGLDFSEQFASICTSAAALPAHHAVIDGEVVVQGANGVPDFGALRSALSKGQHRLLFYAFDLLYLDGFDLRSAPLEGRRRVLAGLIAGAPAGRILMSETIAEPGAMLLRHACEMGLEGIVAKRADAPYRSGRSDAWLKIKCSKVARFPIIGFVPAAGNSIAALRLGRREGKGLVYVGSGASRLLVGMDYVGRARTERTHALEIRG